ncbi:MAG TPA: hypothetical protein VNP04_05030 [Alphaproteobacteria bacterium]|nr:hypothetical protein [Alphaproteobacteria bacterium]
MTHVVTATDGKTDLDEIGPVIRLPNCGAEWKSKWSFLRDASWNWAKHSIGRISDVIEREVPDALLITGGPFLYFEIAHRLNKKLGLPYILDFRDPFVNYLNERRKWRNIIAKILERRWSKRASGILVPIKEMIPYVNLQNGIPVCVVENGYDDLIWHEVAQIDSYNFDREFLKRDGTDTVLVYAGKFHRSPINLLRALKKWSESTLRRGQLVYIGDQIPEQTVREWKKSFPLVNMGFKEYRTSLEIIKSCDIGVIISSGRVFEATTKIYDYISFGKPVLVIGSAKDGAIKSILRNYGNYVMCEDKEDDIFRGIMSIIDIGKTGDEIEIAAQHRWGRRYQASKLADFLERIVP